MKNFKGKAPAPDTPVDWDKPLEHFQGASVEYIGKRTSRAGAEITDGFHHLVVCGAGGASSYVDDFGRVPMMTKGKATVKRIIWNLAPPKQTPAPPQEKNSESASRDLTSAIDALREELDDLKEVMKQESQNFRKLLHSHLSELKNQSSRAQDDFLAAIKLSSEGLHEEIVRAIREGLPQQNPVSGDPPEEPDPAPPPAEEPDPPPFVETHRAARVIVTTAPMPPPPPMEERLVMGELRIRYEDLEMIRSPRLRIAVETLARLRNVSLVVAGDAAVKKAKGVPVGTLRIIRPTQHGLEVRGYDINQARTFWVYTKMPELVAEDLRVIKSIIFKGMTAGVQPK